MHEVYIHIHMNIELGMSNANTSACHLRSIDIKMQLISGDAEASLDIGVFAPWEIMHDEDAQEVDDGMRVPSSDLGLDIERGN
jgi:hypothetical protein